MRTKQTPNDDIWLEAFKEHGLYFSIKSKGVWQCETPRGKIMFYPTTMTLQFKGKQHKNLADMPAIVQQLFLWGLIPKKVTPQ